MEVVVVVVMMNTPNALLFTIHLTLLSFFSMYICTALHFINIPRTASKTIMISLYFIVIPVASCVKFECVIVSPPGPGLRADRDSGWSPASDWEFRERKAAQEQICLFALDAPPGARSKIHILRHCYEVKCWNWGIIIAFHGLIMEIQVFPAEKLCQQ